MPRRSRAATCHHEAGHAVVALALGVNVQRVSVLRADLAPDEAGRCTTEPMSMHGAGPDCSDEVRAAAEAYIMVGLAGGVARARFTGEVDEGLTRGDRK